MSPLLLSIRVMQEPAAHKAVYVLTYNNIMLIHININNLRMSILFCTFVVEIRNIVITAKK